MKTLLYVFFNVNHLFQARIYKQGGKNYTSYFSQHTFG